MWWYYHRFVRIGAEIDSLLARSKSLWKEFMSLMFCKIDLNMERDRWTWAIERVAIIFDSISCYVRCWCCTNLRCEGLQTIEKYHSLVIITSQLWDLYTCFLWCTLFFCINYELIFFWLMLHVCIFHSWILMKYAHWDVNWDALWTLNLWLNL